MTPSRAGVLPVDKPVGPTSHDVVAMVRRTLGEKRVGHTGTLDPFASGLLLLCVGSATRISDSLTGLDKSYVATALLGVATDTEDQEGEEVSRSEGWRDVTPEALEACIAGLRGEIDQVPPRFSAKKVGGVPAHRRARRGEEVVLEARRVTVHELRVLEFTPPEVRFHVRCSSGTYVRSLARELGVALGVGAHLTALRRTTVGDFSVDRAVTTEDLGNPEALEKAWIDPLQALAHLSCMEVDAGSVALLLHGRPVSAGAAQPGGRVAAAHGGKLVAVGEVRGAMFHPKKVFGDHVR